VRGKHPAVEIAAALFERTESFARQISPPFGNRTPDISTPIAQGSGKGMTYGEQT